MQVWSWKKPGFINICKTVAKSLTPFEINEAKLPRFPGYFEAGSVCLLCLLFFHARLSAHAEALQTYDYLHRNDKSQCAG
jgi:hypothetical protein